MNIENKIKKIIEDEVNEKSTLDYKVQEYDLQTNDRWEVLKDVIAMLNSDEALDKDKFIILGVADKNFYVRGLRQDMRDDNEYQNLFEFITPRPKIETGHISINSKIIGYIFIDKINKERPYTISQDNKGFYQGTSFIRKGSKNESLDEKSRERMILRKLIEEDDFHEVYQKISEGNAIKSELIYTDENEKGKKIIDPSNNNGEFVIGKGLYKFSIKFDVATNGVARIMNDYGIHVARIKSGVNLFNSYQDIKYNQLNFNNRYRRYELNDLAIIVNKMGKKALIIFLNVESESHGADNDLIEFKWKIIR